MGTSSTKGNKQGSSATDSSGMGFLLVLIPEEETPPPPDKLLPCSPSPSSATTGSSSSSNLSPSSSFLRKRSSSNRLLIKAQSTISICAVSVFITLLVFTFSTFEPASIPITAPRRLLTQTAGTRPAPLFRFANLWGRSNLTQRGVPKHPCALQGMGTLYRRGTRAMNELVVAHVTETATEDELRLFLRALHRSGLLARADLALILCSSFDSIIREENDSFSQLLLLRYGNSNGTAAPKRSPLWGFDATQFIRPAKQKEKEITEPIWGKRTRWNHSGGDGEAGLTRLSYGSVVSFEAVELDPENSLAGFLDHVPMSLRRWSCYQMLLGRVHRSFKHVMLVDARSSVILGDPLGRFRSRNTDSVYLLNGPEGSSARHGRKNPDKAQGHSSVDPGLIIGGERGVRRLAAAMLTEIVRAAMQNKKRSSVTESAVLSHLAGNEYLLRKVELVRAAEPLLPGPNHSPARSSSDFASIQSDNSPRALIMKTVCSSEGDSSVYGDC